MAGVPVSEAISNIDMAFFPEAEPRGFSDPALFQEDASGATDLATDSGSTRGNYCVAPSGGLHRFRKTGGFARFGSKRRKAQSDGSSISHQNVMSPQKFDEASNSKENDEGSNASDVTGESDKGRFHEPPFFHEPEHGQVLIQSRKEVNSTSTILPSMLLKRPEASWHYARHARGQMTTRIRTAHSCYLH